MKARGTNEPFFHRDSFVNGYLNFCIVLATSLGLLYVFRCITVALHTALHRNHKSPPCTKPSSQLWQLFAYFMHKSVTQFRESVEVFRKCIPLNRSNRNNTHLRNLIHFKCITRAASYVESYETFRQKINLPSSGNDQNFTLPKLFLHLSLISSSFY
jgi:hypothetical protein